MTCRWSSRGRAVASLASLAGIALLPLAAASPAAAARHARLAALAPGALAPSALAPGKWKLLGAAQGSAPGLWRAPDRTDWVVWAKTGSSYSVAKLSSHGVSAGTKSVFPAGSWSGVSFEPALVSDGKVPLLIFSGQRNGGGPLAQGCVVGAVPPSSGSWQVQSWSLSRDCTFANTGFGDAAKSPSGQLSAGWAGGGGVEYRLGTSPSIPAGTADRQIALASGHAQAVAETSNAPRRIRVVSLSTYDIPAQLMEDMLHPQLVPRANPNPTCNRGVTVAGCDQTRHQRRDFMRV